MCYYYIVHIRSKISIFDIIITREEIPVEISLLDYDGTCAPGGGSNPSPNRPPAELRSFLQAMNNHCKVSFITGQPISVAEQMAEAIGIQADISPDHGSFIITPDRKRICTIPHNDLRSFWELMPRIERMITKLGGVKDKRETKACINCFFPNQEAYAFALEIWNQEKNGLGAKIKTTWNKADFSANFLPKCVGKINAVNYYKERGKKMLVGAGDSSSDVDVLRHVLFPIACHDKTLGKPNPLLVSTVEESIKKTGYGHIATQPDGYGLLEGLLKAKEMGVICF